LVTATSAAGGDTSRDDGGFVDVVLGEHLVTVGLTIAPVDQLMARPDACHIRAVRDTAGMRRRRWGDSYACPTGKYRDGDEMSEVDHAQGSRLEMNEFLPALKRRKHT
jgi:hypothetical protein